MKKNVILLSFLAAACIVNAQNVGIGTITPRARLHVVDSSVVFSAADPLLALPGNTPISGIGARMMWYPGKAAFRTGFIDGIQWDKDNIGFYSFASGYSTNANNLYSTAMGRNTIASGTSSTALGYFTIASGSSSTAFGSYNQATGSEATAMNSNTIASGFAATSMGFATIAKGDYSVALGSYTKSKSPSSVVMGLYNDTTNTNRIFEIGNGTADNARRNAVTVLTNGNVGIGTNSPTAPLSFNAFGKIIALFHGASGEAGFGVFGNELRIHSDYSNADITFGYDDYTLGFTERMRIKGTGNVGIGTTNPTTKLHVSAGDASLALFGPNAAGGKLYVGASGNLGVASTAQVIASDGNLHIDPAPAKNIHIGYYQPRDIYLNPNGGNVGIGTTTAPAAKLHVSAGDASLALFGPNAAGGSLYVGASDQGVASTAQVITAAGNLYLDPAPGEDIYLGNRVGAGDIYLNRVSGGNVGIRTITPPTATLHVNGSTRLEGHTKLGGLHAPAIQMYKLTGTTASTEGGSVIIPRGLYHESKILSISVLVFPSVDVYFPPNVPGSGYNFYWNSTVTGIQVTNVSGQSANILSKPIKILITYEE